MTTSLVIGKFWPPHGGHLAMLQFAQQRTDKLYVIVCSSPTTQPSGQQRARWIQQIFPTAEVILTDDFCAWHHPEPCVPACTPKWAARTGELISEKIDEFVASEEYGERFAAQIGARCVEFDPPRNSHPLSGTDVRNNLTAHWFGLHEVVRAGLCRKITVMGAESTGTTTLSRDLARELECPLVPEIGRTVSWELMADAGSMDEVRWTREHFWRILSEHASAEDAARAQAANLPCSSVGAFFVADTDAVATIAWWERYLALDTDQVWEFARTRLADAYIVTSPNEVPFFQDGIRDGESLRQSMTDRFLELAYQSGKPVLVAQGTPQERLRHAADFVRSLGETFPIFAP